MSITTPAWWYKRGASGAPWWRFALWPLSLVWQGVNAAKRANVHPYRSPLFVISVGNVTLGGSGKTPIAGEILRLLKDAGIEAAGLSRGYGGNLEGPVQVDPARHTAAEVGDEPLMLSQTATQWIARDRAAGLRAIEGTSIRAVVLDDAHQNLRIVKDLHILVVDGNTANGAWPFGDGGVCPYGPMREPLSEGLERADLVVLWMPDATSAPDPSLIALLSAKPVFVARLTPVSGQAPGRAVAFAGIAKPWQFRATLDSVGYETLSFTGFPDHESPSESALEAMAAEAQAAGAQLLTTQKDWVRLDAAWRERVACLPIVARFEDEAKFISILADNVNHKL